MGTKLSTMCSVMLEVPPSHSAIDLCPHLSAKEISTRNRCCELIG